jgi:hypothetical protein
MAEAMSPFWARRSATETMLLSVPGSPVRVCCLGLPIDIESAASTRTTVTD